MENYDTYDELLKALQNIFLQAQRILKKKKYLSIIIRDFTINKVETNVTGHITNLMTSINYDFVGNTVSFSKTSYSIPLAILTLTK